MTNEFRLKNGNIVLVTDVEGGVYTSSQLRKIAALCESQSLMAKATEDQRLALIVSPNQKDTVVSELNAIGIQTRHYQRGLHQPVSCLGGLCSEHKQDALETSMDITSELSQSSTQEPLKIAVNGCSQCCTPCHTYDISLIGDASGYNISIGGKNSQYPEFASLIAEGVPASEAASAVKKIIDTYNSNASPGESLQAVIERVGFSTFSNSLSNWSNEPVATYSPDGTLGELDLDQTTQQAKLTTSEVSPLASVGSSSDLAEIPVKQNEHESHFDIQIGASSDLTSEIRIHDSESDDESSQQTNDDEISRKLEDGLEAFLTEDISDLANASQELEAVAERDRNTELLATSAIELNRTTEDSVEPTDEKLEHDLIDITSRLAKLETELRTETEILSGHPTSKPWDFSSFDIDERGNPIITWSNGIQTIIDVSAHKSGTFMVGQRKINFRLQSDNVEVEVDGLRIVLPLAA